MKKSSTLHYSLSFIVNKTLGKIIQNNLVFKGVCLDARFICSLCCFNITNKTNGPCVIKIFSRTPIFGKDQKKRVREGKIVFLTAITVC